MTAEQILAFLEQHRAELKAMGVQKIGLFGSYVRGEQTAESDVDFLVTITSPSYTDFMNLWHFLEDHLQLKVDLGEEDYLREEIQPYVMKEVRYVTRL